MLTRQSLAAIVLSGLILAVLVFLGVRNYEGNVSALLHMDAPFGEMHEVPSGLVLYKDAAYDGMLYYQVALDIPALVRGEKPSLDSPYRFQRILLPALVFVVTLGNEDWFPIALLAINLLCAMGALIVMLKLTKGKTLHALTAVLNPAILVGILFTLTEPLSLFLMTLFFWVWIKNNHRITFLAVLLLLLSLLARETTIFLIGLLFLWSIWKRQWKDSLLLIIPILVLVGWQYILELRLGAVGFQANGNIVSVPFGGPVALLIWAWQGLNSYRLSSLALLCFVIPLFLLLGKQWLKEKTHISVLCFLLSGLVATMLTMDTHMWGAITSIGRVVTPLYPVYALYAAERDSWLLRALSVILILVSVGTAIGIALARHPFIIS